MNADDPVLDEEFTQDPYPLYRRLRRECPVARVRIPSLHLTTYLITRYDDVRSVLANPDVAKDSGASLTEPFTHHMLNRDAPAHTRLRAAVSAAFTARRVAAVRHRIERLAESLVNGIAGRDEIDLIDAFAYPFAMGVLRDILGVAEAEDPDFRQVAEVLFEQVDPQVRAEPASRMTDYLRRLVRAKRSRPGDDLLTQLVHARDVRGLISEDELLSTVFLLLVAGHETTVNLIGNGVWVLLRHPDQLRELRADPSLLPGAVEEVLRFAGPADVATLRHTKDRVRVGDVEIPAGEFVLAAIGAANRDEDRYREPDRFSIHRVERSMAFGFGIHHCLGASLARVEGEVGIGALLGRFPDLDFARDPDLLRWRNNTMMRGLTALPVRLGAPVGSPLSASAHRTSGGQPRLSDPLRSHG